jgi:hypothetical protein
MEMGWKKKASHGPNELSDLQKNTLGQEGRGKEKGGAERAEGLKERREAIQGIKGPDLLDVTSRCFERGKKNKNKKKKQKNKKKNCFCTENLAESRGFGDGQSYREAWKKIARFKDLIRGMVREVLLAPPIGPLPLLFPGSSSPLVP